MRNLALTLLIGAAAVTATGAAKPSPGCDRACLDGMVDRYLDAMADRKPEALPWAEVVRYSENSVSQDIGEGIWLTVTAHGQTALRAADPGAGEVAWMGEIEEHGQPGFLALRLKVKGGKIAEAEAVIRRKGGPPQYGDPTAWAHDPSFAQAAGAKDRPGRAGLVAAVNRYFDGVQGKPGARPAADCARLDNGVATTSGDAAEGGVQGCEAQLKAGVFKPISRVRARLYPVVDEARGVVIATGFLDLPSREVRQTGAKPLSFVADYPYSLGFMAAFKLKAGRVYRIDAVSDAQPYLMPTPWSGGGAK